MDYKEKEDSVEKESIEREGRKKILKERYEYPLLGGCDIK